jgi:phosphotransferase system enzyme I (PtsI)
MAGDLALTPLLLGLGMDELSVGASTVPRVKRAVQSLTQTECQKLVSDIMELDTPSSILGRCTQLAQTRYGELLGA